jgi:hypothetical protein
MSPVRQGPENDCAGEGQQQLQTTDPSSSQRGSYIVTITASVQLKEVDGLKSQRSFSQDELVGGKPLVA